MPESRQLRECCQQSSLAVADQEPVIERVKVLGTQSKNGRRYLTEAMSSGLHFYEGAKVNLDHQTAKAQHEPRSILSRFGKLERVTVEADGMYANLRYNPSHPYASAVKWFAENMPECLGLSHNAVGKGEVKNGVFEVNQIVGVSSVDVVADPATVKSLYESQMGPENMDSAVGMQPETTPEPEADGGDSCLEKLQELVAAIVGDKDLSLEEKKKKLALALKMLDDGETDKPKEGDGSGETNDDEEDYAEAVKVLASSTDPHVKRLVETVDKLTTAKKLAEARDNAKRLCEAAKLPAKAITDVFLESLIAQPNEAGMKKLIEDRKQLTGIQTPRSAPPAKTGANNLSAKEFAQQLRR